MVTPATLFAWCNSLVEAFDDCLYPPHCILSGKPLSTIDVSVARVRGILNAALDAADAAPSSLELLALIEKHVPTDCVFISQIHALWKLDVESAIDNAMYAIKYKGRTQLATDLGRELGRYLRQFVYTKAECAELIVQPIPIHSARVRERGYNQAAFIARGVADGCGIDAVNVVSAVRRTRYTGTQTHLGESNRILNVSGVFDVSNVEQIRSRHILLIDDVLTTGSTLNACATELINCGAKRVDAATLCMAV